jgi:hypothetical protein
MHHDCFRVDFGIAANNTMATETQMDCLAEPLV